MPTNPPYFRCEIVTALAQSIFDCVKETLALELSAQNEAISAQSVLPDEVWCGIWEYLPFFDCVAVTHVCGRWRRAALVCPTVWQRVTCYTTLHSDHCECRECAGNDRGLCCRCWDIEKDDFPPHIHRLPSGWESCPYRPEFTNFDAAFPILQRSADLPLSITLDIVPYYAQWDSFKRLAQVLQPHIHRLRELRIRSADTDAVSQFFSRFTELPSLRDLTVELLKNTESFCLPQNIFPGQIALPAIDKIHLGPKYDWPGGHHFPTIRFLSLTPRNAIQIARPLRACPGLKYLTLDMTEFKRTTESDNDGSDDDSDDDAQDPFRLLPEQIASLKVVGPSHRTQWVISAGTSCAIEHLTWTVPEGEWWDRSYPVAEVAQDLGGQINISFEMRESMLIAQGVDNHGRQRQVQWHLLAHNVRMGYNKPEGIIQSFLEPILSRGVVQLSIGISVWPAFVKASPSSLHVECLCIVLDEPMDGDESSVLVRHADVCFPALKTLRITARDRAIAMTAADIAILLHHFGLRVPVDNLAVDHRMLIGDPGPLYKLAAVVDLDFISSAREEP